MQRSPFSGVRFCPIFQKFLPRRLPGRSKGKTTCNLLRDELKKERCLGWAVPYFNRRQLYPDYTCICSGLVWQGTVATQIKVKLIPPKYFIAFAFVLILLGTDALSHSCSHRHFTPKFTFAFVRLKVINSDIILFRFASLCFLSLEIRANPDN